MCQLGFAGPCNTNPANFDRKPEPIKMGQYFLRQNMKKSFRFVNGAQTLIRLLLRRFTPPRPRPDSLRRVEGDCRTLILCAEVEKILSLKNIIPQ